MSALIHANAGELSTAWFRHAPCLVEAMDALPRKRVLLVDDEARSVRLLARMLREDGYEVEVVYDGAAAIGRLTRDPLPDALVTGLPMPHVDGVAVARYARARAPSMSVVFLTSHPELLHRSDFKPAAIVHAQPVQYAVLRTQLGCAEVPIAFTQGEPMKTTASEHEKRAPTPEHGVLLQMLGRLENAAGAGAVGELLDDLREYLQVHFAAEERPHGFFENITHSAPWQAATVAALRAEHGTLLDEVVRLRREVARDLHAVPDAVTSAVTALLAGLRRHEEVEEQLLVDSHTTEHGGG